MRAVVQRVTRARVTVAQVSNLRNAQDSIPSAGSGQALCTRPVVGEIERGLAVLVGVQVGDTEQDAAYLAKKIAGLRVFEDPEGKLNLSAQEVGAAILAVSNFTLLGDCRKGRRPSFTDAAPPEQAESLFDAFVAHIRAAGLAVATGVFREHMHVEIHNDGPVTLILDSRRGF